MKKLILFLVFVVNLHIPCNKEAVGVDFGICAYAQEMTYEAQTEHCEGDDFDPDGYYSSIPCENQIIVQIRAGNFTIGAGVMIAEHGFTWMSLCFSVSGN